MGVILISYWTVKHLFKVEITDALLIDDSWADKTVVVTGYLAGVSGSSTKYINTFATSVTVKEKKTKLRR